MRGLSVAAPNPMLAKSPTSRRCYDAAGTSKLRTVHVDVEHRPRRPAPLYGQRLSGAEPGRSCRLRGVRRGDPARRPALLERRQTGTLCQRRDRHPGRHRGMIRAYWLGGVAALATLASCVGPPDNRPPAPIPAPVPQPVPSPTPAPLPPATFDLAGEMEQGAAVIGTRSEEHTSELQSLMRISYAVFCLKKKKKHIDIQNESTHKQTHTSK